MSLVSEPSDPATCGVITHVGQVVQRRRRRAAAPGSVTSSTACSRPVRARLLQRGGVHKGPARGVDAAWRARGSAASSRRADQVAGLRQRGRVQAQHIGLGECLGERDDLGAGRPHQRGIDDRVHHEDPADVAAAAAAPPPGARPWRSPTSTIVRPSPDSSPRPFAVGPVLAVPAGVGGQERHLLERPQDRGHGVLRDRFGVDVRRRGDEEVRGRTPASPTCAAHAARRVQRGAQVRRRRQHLGVDRRAAPRGDQHLDVGEARGARPARRSSCATRGSCRAPPRAAQPGQLARRRTGDRRRRGLIASMTCGRCAVT